MKKFIVVSLAVLLALSASCCNFFGSLVNPVIGTWQTTILGVSTTSVFNADHSCTDTTTIAGIGVTKSGTWASDGSILTKTWADASVYSYSYSFNSDKSEMTLAPSPIGLALVYTRQ